jgi:hypothetical protein
MADDFGLNVIPEDELQDDIVTEDELRNQMERMRNRSIPLVFAPMLIPFTPFLVPSVASDITFISTMVITCLISLVGIHRLMKSSILGSFLYGIRILRRVGFPEPVITEQYAATKRGATFLFILRSASLLYFVSFSQTETSPSRVIDVPKTFWKWNPTMNVSGLKLHKREGLFSIPTLERQYISGEGILYASPFLGAAYMLHVPDFSRGQLLAVAEYVSQQVSG